MDGKRLKKKKPIPVIGEHHVQNVAKYTRNTAKLQQTQTV